MRDTAAKSGSGLASKLLQYVATQSLAMLAGGGVGAFLKPVAGQLASKVLGEFANKVVDFTGGLVTGSMQNDMLADDLKKRQAALDTINATLASRTGEFVEAAVESLEDDSVDRTKWLMQAPLSQLNQFRIPEAVPVVDKGLIRAVVAGVIAAQAHQHDADKPCDSWGLQCGIAEFVPPDSVGELDDNVIKIGVKAVPSGIAVRYTKFFTASSVLAKELAQKARLSMVPKMALRIEIESGESALAAAHAILAATGIQFGPARDRIGPQSQAEESFTRRYEQLRLGHQDSSPQIIGASGPNPALITRNPEAGLRMSGFGLSESLWLYELATGDSSLRKLAGDIEERHRLEEENVVSDTNEPVSLLPSGSRLSELTYAVIEPTLVIGVQKLIADLGYLTLPSVEPKGDRVAR